MVKVPLRVAPVLASKVKMARPLPVPLAVVCSHEALEVAVQDPRKVDDEIRISAAVRTFEQRGGP